MCRCSGWRAGTAAALPCLAGGDCRLSVGTLLVHVDEPAVSDTVRRSKAALAHRVKIVGIVLLGMAFGAEALTLGRIQGAVLVGQGLNVVVPVQLDAGENAASLCFGAEVFHADIRQDASRVQVRVEAVAQQPDAARVRILSSAVIDEPIVSVNLSTGCGQKTTRRYVLLADPPGSDVARSVPTLPLSAPAAPPARAANPANPANPALPAAADPALKGRTTRAAPQKARPKVLNPRPAAPKVPVASSSMPSEGAPPTAPPSGQPRLSLDALEFFSDRIANLELAAPVTAPEEVLQSQQKIQQLEASVTTLRALMAKNEASLADLTVRLQVAESSRFSAPLVYALVGLVLACLVALAVLWTRQRRMTAAGGEWWRGSHHAAQAAALGPRPEPGLLADPVARDEARLPKKHEAPGSGFSDSAPDSRPSSAVDVQHMDMSDSYFQNLIESKAPDSTHRKPAASPVLARVMVRRPGPVRHLEDDAILDIRQQAEFFVSLGQPEQALRILKRQIEESEEPNPFIYLDMIGVAHLLGLRVEFQRLREDFKHLFKGRIPEFVFFEEEGRHLESYPEVLSRITALWPTPAALALLESCIFQDNPEACAQPFDLAAFRDLLMLHAVAHDVALLSDPSGGPSPGGPLPVAGASVMPAQPQNGNDPAPALDIDLSDSRPQDQAPPPLPGSPADVDLPLLMPDEPDAADADARTPLDRGNLIDFDLPLEPTPAVDRSRLR